VSFWDTTIQFFWREESFAVLVVALCIAFLSFHFSGRAQEHHQHAQPVLCLPDRQLVSGCCTRCNSPLWRRCCTKPL